MCAWPAKPASEKLVVVCLLGALSTLPSPPAARAERALARLTVAAPLLLAPSLGDLSLDALARAARAWWARAPPAERLLLIGSAAASAALVRPPGQRASALALGTLGALGATAPTVGSGAKASGGDAPREPAPVPLSAFEAIGVLAKGAAARAAKSTVKGPNGASGPALAPGALRHADVLGVFGLVTFSPGGAHGWTAPVIGVGVAGHWLPLATVSVHGGASSLIVEVAGATAPAWAFVASACALLYLLVQVPRQVGL